MASEQEKSRDQRVQVDSSDVCVSTRVPPEIWVKIFNLFKPRSSNLTTLRPVCTQWQRIIDENFDMKVKINDDIMDVYSVFNFKRVTQCIVSKYNREDTFPLLSPTQLFWDPKILSSLIIRGTISRPNFLVLARQCTNVKQLFLTGYLLVGDRKLFEAESVEETNILSKFMSGLQKLVINGLSISSSNDLPTQLFSLLSWQMNELKELVVRISYLDAAESKMFFQLLETFRSLESIELTLRGYDTPLQFTPFVLPSLTTLNLVRFEERLADWLPLISAQNRIKTLRIIIDRCNFELDLPLVEAILTSRNTLQSLEIRQFRNVCNRIGDQFFGRLVVLKILKLEGYKQPRIMNLDLLPCTMETLVLENVEVKTEELELLAGRMVIFTTTTVKIC